MAQRTLVCFGLVLLLITSLVHAAPLNDTCASAQELYITMTGSGNTSSATVDGDSTCGGINAGPDVWYEYYATTTGYLSVSTFGSGFDTVLSVHDESINGCPGDDSDTVACNDDCVAGTPGFSCINNIPILEGHYYKIRIAGYNGAAGAVSLSFGKATISGKVVDATTNQPIQNASVEAKSRLDPSFENASAAGALTDANGNYTLNLPAGSYQIVSQRGSYLSEAYDGVDCGDGCSRTTGPATTVTNGQNLTNINFSLDPAATVSGTVTDKETGAPLAGVMVYFEANEFNGGLSGVKFATTDANGNYTGTNLPPRTYYPFISGLNGYAPQLYHDIPCTKCAGRTDGNPVFAAAGTNTTGIDFQMSKGTTVTGTVTDESTGLPIDGAVVKIHGVDSATTDAQGHYSISGVPSGKQAMWTGKSGYAYELYSNVPCLWFSTCHSENGTMLDVPADTTLENVNIALTPQAKITGTVTDAVTAQGIFGLRDLTLYDSTGKELVSFGCCSGPNFSFDSLSAGTYYISTNAIGYVGELYNNLPCPGKSCNPLTGTPITVQAGQTVSGIQIALTPAGSISGKVLFGATPISYALISVYNSNGDLVIDRKDADNLGVYKIDGLPTGSYYVKAESGTGSVNKRYIPKVYPNADCMVCAPQLVGTPVAVVAGSETGNINFTLPQGGSVAGKIVSSVGGVALPATVSIFDGVGHLVSKAMTDGSGQYVSKTGLVAGDYFVFADAGLGYTSEMYNDFPCAGGECNLFNGNIVNVASSATTLNINFGLNSCSDLNLTPSSIPPMTAGQSYGQQFSAFGTQGAAAYDVVDGQLPTGITLSSSGLLSGTPQAGTYQFVVRVTDAGGCTRSNGYTMEVVVVPCIFCDDFQDGTEAVDWTYAKGLWDENNGALVATAPSGSASSFAIPAFNGCTNCYMETSIRTAGGSLNKIWFFPWYQNKSNTVEVLMKEESDKIILRQRVNGVIVSKGKASVVIVPNQFYTIRVNYTGSAFQLLVDGNVAATIPAPSQPFGSVGYQVKNTVGSFGHVMVN